MEFFLTFGEGALKKGMTTSDKIEIMEKQKEMEFFQNDLKPPVSNFLIW